MKGYAGSVALPLDEDDIRSRLRRLPVPDDYFSATRSSPSGLWPERILCFARRNGAELRVEPPLRHHHHRCVLTVPWEGRGEVEVDGRRFSLRPGTALLILPFQFHRHLASADVLLWQFITFELRLPGALEELRPQPLRRLEKDDPPLLAAFLRAWTGPRSRQGELAPWLGLMLDRLRRAPLPVGGRSRAVVEDSLIARINRHCLPHLHEAFGLKEVAARLGVSESHLRARFRQETGMSLGRHVRRLRLQKAMGLLSQSDLSVTEIAEQCGFEGVFAFSRSFHRFAGMPATAYRRHRKS